jgi:hypothetical protein
LAQGGAKAGLLHQTLVVSVVLMLALALQPWSFAPAHSVTSPTITYEQLAATRAPLPSLSPSPSPSAAPAAAAKKKYRGSASVLGSSTARGGGGFAYGMAAGGGLGALSAAALKARLEDMKALGVTWVRYDMDWSNIEAAGPGNYNWGDYDRVVQAVSAHGLRALAILDYTPGWARRSDCTDSKMCVPADPGAYARFAAAAAARYAGYGVHAWEIWNEPNNLNFFQPAADPAAYTALLKAAYGAIKGVDGGATIVTGGTAPADTGDGYVSPPDFVNGMYAAGARGYFDVVAHHPYSWPYSPAYHMSGNAWDQLSTIHGIMSRYGDGGKKIWITEFGAPTGGPGRLAASGMTTAEGGADHVTEALEAKMASDGVAVMRSYPWVGAFFWYSYQDVGTASDTVENFFGLRRYDGSPKPAYFAYQSAIASH